MEKRFLATFIVVIDGMFLNGYRWFETKEEMDKSINGCKGVLRDIKKFEIEGCKEVQKK